MNSFAFETLHLRNSSCSCVLKPFRDDPRRSLPVRMAGITVVASGVLKVTNCWGWAVMWTSSLRGSAGLHGERVKQESSWYCRGSWLLIHDLENFYKISSSPFPPHKLLPVSVLFLWLGDDVLINKYFTHCMRPSSTAWNMVSVPDEVHLIDVVCTSRNSQFSTIL